MPSGLHRTYGAHHLHFITCSCYRRLPFLNSAKSRDRFLSILEQTRERYRFVVVGYVLMPEHFHLLITEPEVGTPSTVMQVLKQRTAHSLLPRRKRRDPRQGQLFGEESSGEAPVHASQSREARTGGICRTVAVEQLPVLSAGRRRARASGCGVVKDFVSRSRSVRRSALNDSRRAPVAVDRTEVKISTRRQHRSRPRKKREDGAPLPWRSR